MSKNRGPTHHRPLQVMTLSTMLISRKMIFGKNLASLGLAVVELKDVSWVLELADGKSVLG
jgi:hypothetical protein